MSCFVVRLRICNDDMMLVASDSRAGAADGAESLNSFLFVDFLDAHDILHERRMKLEDVGRTLSHSADSAINPGSDV
jgi:Ethanolamine utilization protein EutJ (predicted chaperonin)